MIAPVSESATKSVRERRKERTRADLIARARKLTREVGLSGFTIDELCADVGVARRTFFNYFATKEHAVIGRSHDDEDDEIVFESLTRDRHLPLVDRMTQVAIDHFHEVEGRRDEALELMTLIEEEPKLLATMLEVTREGERRLAEAIAEVEQLPPDDPRPALAVQIGGIVLHRSMQQFLRPDERRSFEDVVHANTELARSLFLPTHEGRPA